MEIARRRAGCDARRCWERWVLKEQNKDKILQDCCQSIENEAHGVKGRGYKG